ncbi:hypothetical protein IAI51_13240 [Pseudomonas sp. N40(2020)]|nr:hypothetical protein [Pseudomonas sp. N40(2020)]
MSSAASTDRDTTVIRGYGKQLLPTLAKELTAHFGKGFDASNLRYMRLFYQAFPIRDALRLELSWTHYRRLLRVENDKARQWYMDECATLNLSEGDKPTVGITLCAQDNEAVARYSIFKGNE